MVRNGIRNIKNMIKISDWQSQCFQGVIRYLSAPPVGGTLDWIIRRSEPGEGSDKTEPTLTIL